jgi:hypothetical protein
MPSVVNRQGESVSFWNIVRAKNPTHGKAKSWPREPGKVLEQEV